MPSKRTPTELSISRIGSMNDATIWETGRTVVKISGRSLYARGDFSALKLADVRLPNVPALTARPDPPPDSHALIVGWSADLDAAKSCAQQIALRSTGHAAPPA